MFGVSTIEIKVVLIIITLTTWMTCLKILLDLWIKRKSQWQLLVDMVSVLKLLLQLPSAILIDLQVLFSWRVVLSTIGIIMLTKS